MLLAASSPDSPFDITAVLQFGLLGLIFLCLVFRKFIVPEWTLVAAENKAEAEKALLLVRIGELQEQVTRLQAAYEDQIIPAVTRSTEINAKYLEELQQDRLRGGTTP